MSKLRTVSFNIASTCEQQYIMILTHSQQYIHVLQVAILVEKHNDHIKRNMHAEKCSYMSTVTCATTKHTVNGRHSIY